MSAITEAVDSANLLGLKLGLDIVKLCSTKEEAVEQLERVIKLQETKTDV